MQIVRSRTYEAARAWGSMLLLQAGEHHARLHWTDQPYRWHVNDGDELFVVLDGEVDMLSGAEGAEQVHFLAAGDMAVIAAGERHVAHPRGVARILVLERRDSP